MPLQVLYLTYNSCISLQQRWKWRNVTLQLSHLVGSIVVMLNLWTTEPDVPFTTITSLYAVLVDWNSRKCSWRFHFTSIACHSCDSCQPDFAVASNKTFLYNYCKSHIALVDGNTGKQTTNFEFTTIVTSAQLSDRVVVRSRDLALLPSVSVYNYRICRWCENRSRLNAVCCRPVNSTAVKVNVNFRSLY